MNTHKARASGPSVRGNINGTTNHARGGCQATADIHVRSRAYGCGAWKKTYMARPPTVCKARLNEDVARVPRGCSSRPHVRIQRGRSRIRIDDNVMIHERKQGATGRDILRDLNDQIATRFVVENGVPIWDPRAGSNDDVTARADAAATTVQGQLAANSTVSVTKGDVDGARTTTDCFTRVEQNAAAVTACMRA